MPSKIKAIPLRMPDELRAQVQARAQAEGKKEHSMVLELLAAAFEAPVSTPKPAPVRQVVAPQPSAPELQREPGVHIPTTVPLAGTFERKPLQKAEKTGRARWK